MTINAAYALFMEEKVGSLKPGKFADLIILSDNPLTVAPDSLIDLEVLMTMVGGRVELLPAILSKSKDKRDVLSLERPDCIRTWMSLSA